MILKFYFMREMAKMLISDIQRKDYKKAERHARKLCKELTIVCEEAGAFNNK